MSGLLFFHLSLLRVFPFSLCRRNQMESVGDFHINGKCWGYFQALCVAHSPLPLCFECKPQELYHSACDSFTLLPQHDSNLPYWSPACFVIFFTGFYPWWINKCHFLFEVKWNESVGLMIVEKLKVNHVFWDHCEIINNFFYRNGFLNTNFDFKETPRLIVIGLANVMMLA